MGLRITQVDAFTKVPFAGNPAAVCVLEAPRPDEWLLAVAREMNLSETAYLVKREDGWDLRWFTPAVEVPLCGHATLASAHALWEEGHAPRGEAIRFHTKSGVLVARADDALIELDFPAIPAVACDPPEGLLDGIGAAGPNKTAEAVFVGKGTLDYLVELGSEREVRALSPDFTALRKLGVRGVMVTARGSGESDVVSRFFAPGAGIDEDPVTGSAHCSIGPHWAGRLGKTTLRCHQASARGGDLRVRVAGDRVFLGGHAVTVLRADLLVEH